MDINSLRAHQLKALCGSDSFERGAVSRKDVGEVGATTAAERSTVRPTNKSDSHDRIVAVKEDRVDSIVDQEQQQLQKMRDLPFHVASIGGTNVVQFNDHIDNGLMQIDGEVRNHLDGLAMKRPHIDTTTSSSSSSSSSLDKDKEHTITVGEHDRVHLLHGSNSRLKVNEVKSKESSQKILSLLKAKKNDQSKD